MSTVQLPSAKKELRQNTKLLARCWTVKPHQPCAAPPDRCSICLKFFGPGQAVLVGVWPYQSLASQVVGVAVYAAPVGNYLAK